MGGDGGVIASNRKYLRGAGTADHTADAARKRGNGSVDPVEVMTTCAVTGTPLNFASTVACPYGRLYGREAAVEALLRRAQRDKIDGDDFESIGGHVRGLKDLHPVRFQLGLSSDETKPSSSVPVCPMTGLELNGMVPALLLVSKNDKKTTPNVVSERALKEMGLEALQAEYGPFDDVVRLAPPASSLGEIKEQLEQTRTLEKLSKKSKKKDGTKRKKMDETKDKCSIATKVQRKVLSSTLIKSQLSSTVASNAVLSSLYNSSSTEQISEKEKNNNLFAR